MAAGARGRIHTTKEIASLYNIPYELLAKVMQKLMHSGLITSYQGVNGGYIIRCDPGKITISEIMAVIEGKPGVKIVQCEAQKLEQCIIQGTCTIKDPLVKLQGNINQVLERMTVTELL